MALRLWLVAALIAPAFWACAEHVDPAPIDPRDLAAEAAGLFCDAFSACECALPLEDPSACVEAVTPVFTAQLAAGDEASLHTECLEPIRKYLAALACRPAREIEGDFMLEQLAYEMRRCKLLSGRRKRDDACWATGSTAPIAVGDSCEQPARPAQLRQRADLRSSHARLCRRRGQAVRREMRRKWSILPVEQFDVRGKAVTSG
jgi:hypothetical protein